MTAHCAPALNPSHSYFVVMIDHGWRGREAIVDPEITRREVVSRILRGDYPAEAIVFIHWCHDGVCEDVTFDIVAECARETIAQSPSISGQDLIDWRNDHRRELIKHGD